MSETTQSTAFARPSAPVASARPGPAKAGPAKAGPAKAGSARRWYRLISPIALVLIWQLVSSAGVVSAQKLPPPTTVWRTAVNLVTQNSPAYGTLQGAMLVSLQRMGMGFRVGAPPAIVFALIAGLSRLGEHAVDPPLQILRTLPLFGLVP